MDPDFFRLDLVPQQALKELLADSNDQLWPGIAPIVSSVSASTMPETSDQTAFSPITESVDQLYERYQELLNQGFTLSPGEFYLSEQLSENSDLASLDAIDFETGWDSYLIGQAAESVVFGQEKPAVSGIKEQNSGFGIHTEATNYQVYDKINWGQDTNNIR